MLIQKAILLNNDTNNNSLVLKNSQNTENSNKITNLSNNTENLAQALNSQIQNKNLVKDKSEAVNEILGYGVDNEGFFTSDFNEKAGISKEYRIYAKGAENFVNSFNKNSAYFTNIDLAKSLGNAYKVFTQLFENVDEKGFGKEQIENLPIAFTFKEEKDRSNIKVLQKLSKEEFVKTFSYDYPKDIVLGDIFLGGSASELAQGKRAENIFEQSKMNINASIYTDEDGYISKGGVLMAFFTTTLASHYFMEGETTIKGKAAGWDKSMSKVDDLNDFISQHGQMWYSEGKEPDLMFKAWDLEESNLSIEEFKKAYLALREESNKNKIKFEENIKKQDELMKALNQAEQQNEESASKKNFTPIQATSKNQIYKDTGYFKFKDLLKNQQDLDMLSILFNSIKNDKNFSNTNNNINNTLLNLMRTNIFNGIDIKA